MSETYRTKKYNKTPKKYPPSKNTKKIDVLSNLSMEVNTKVM